MEESHIKFSLFFSVLLLFPIVHEGSTGSAYGTSKGYVEVRKGAHLFWSYYESQNKTNYQGEQWPLILWLQGGPGSPSFGFGNFWEIGPIDDNLNTRNTTWLRVADLLFVDSPVGTGFSFVEDQRLLVETDAAAAVDLTTLLVSLSKKYEFLNTSPLYIVGESYGGRIAVELGLNVLKAIEDGELKITLGGVALGNSWISPIDSLSSWATLLYDMSLIGYDDQLIGNRTVDRIKQQLKDKNFIEAAKSATIYMYNLSTWSHSVSFYNFLLKENSFIFDNNLTALMNDVIKKEINIIPKHVVWENLSDPVFTAMQGDFMTPRVKQVDQLLDKGVNVSIYNGQFDLMCSAVGTEAWVNKLEWPELPSFLVERRVGIGCIDNNDTKAYRKIYKNLAFFWILNAGHYVPKEQGPMTLRMIARIINSPAFSEDLCLT